MEKPQTIASCVLTVLSEVRSNIWSLSADDDSVSLSEGKHFRTGLMCISPRTALSFTLMTEAEKETVRGTVSPTNGQVERMNRTIREGEADQNMIRWIIFPLNVKRGHHDSDEQLRSHLADFSWIPVTLPAD